MNKYLPIGIAILVSVGGVWYVSQLNKFTIPEPPISEEAQVQTQEIATKPLPTFAEMGISVVKSGNMMLFTDLQTGISFSYPSEWGSISAHDDSGQECPSTMIDRCNFRVYLFPDTTGAGGIFLATGTLGNKQYPPNRDAFWGDWASHISQSLAIECARSNKCSPFINSQGTIIAKRMIYDFSGESNTDGSDKEMERLGYYVFSDKGPYYGIILSAARFSKPGDVIEKQFEETVVSSLKLSNH